MRRRGPVRSLSEDPEIKEGEVFLVRRTVADKEQQEHCEVIEVKTLTSSNPLLFPSSSSTSDSSSFKRVRFSEPFAPTLTSAAAAAAAEVAARNVAEELANQLAQHDELEAAVRGIQDFTRHRSEDGEDDDYEPSPVKSNNRPEIPSVVTYSIYYVHFLNNDRRLDTWLDKSKFIERKSPEIAGVPSSLSLTPSGVGNQEAPKSSVVTRSLKRIHEEFNHLQKNYSDMDATTAAMERAHEAFTKVKNLDIVIYGNYQIEVWYFSPFPKEVCSTGKLYICEYCLVYMDDLEEYLCHVRHVCKEKQPPGKEIYRSGSLAVYEVDGKANKIYCQCLCLLSKLFMDHKTLYFDVDTFLFYILCEVDSRGSHVVGHFSKERNSMNNLACIMIMPPFQRKGYGKFLIQLSYALSNREGVIGTPEKPLSDLGKVSYRSYWWYLLLKLIEENKIEDITVSDLSRNSGIHHDDIISTMQTVGMIKYWKGDYVVRSNKRIVDELRSKMKVGSTPRLLLHEEFLRWTPAQSWQS